jgi:hypothetical protein
MQVFFFVAAISNYSRTVPWCYVVSLILSFSFFFSFSYIISTLLLCYLLAGLLACLPLTVDEGDVVMKAFYSRVCTAHKTYYEIVHAHFMYISYKLFYFVVHFVFRSFTSQLNSAALPAYMQTHIFISIFYSVINCYYYSRHRKKKCYARRLFFFFEKGDSFSSCFYSL